VARCGELSPIARRFTRVLGLRGYWTRSRISRHRQLLRRRPRFHSAAPAVVTYTIMAFAWHRIAINIANGRRIYIGDGPIISQTAMIPVGAIIAAARIPVAVVDASIEPDVWAPISAIENINAVVETPPWRRPQRAHPRSQDPCSGDPVISDV